MTPATTTAQQIEAALRAKLPPELYPQLHELSEELAKVAAREQTPEEASASLNRPEFAAAFQALAAKESVDVEGLRFAFGGDKITIGNIVDSNALAVGRGAIAIKLTVQTEEQVYKVHGLDNPYLGLEAFTYERQGKFAGRKREVTAAVDLLTAPGAQRSLLFITGASGSGKSSFAQAGLLPALETFYRQRHQDVQHAVFRPSRLPLDAFKDALLQLGLPAGKLALEAVLERPGRFALFLQHVTPPPQVNLIVLDQFEELFTQSEPAQRDALFAILAHLPPFADLHTHLIATMRSDYLPELFERKALYEIAKSGVDLRAMGVVELKEAIQRPLQQELEAKGKCFEPALLDRLAHDATSDAANLPLLQVTLTDLWQRGSLRLSAYSNLSAAISESAEKVYNLTFVHANKQPRPPADQAAIMAIFLDLVKVGLDDNSRHDSPSCPWSAITGRLKAPCSVRTASAF